MSIDHVYSIRCEFLQIKSKEWLVTSINSLASIALEVTPLQVCLHYSLQVKTTDVFPSPKFAQHIPAQKASQQREGFLVSSRLISLCSATQVYGVIITGSYHPSYGKQPQTVAIICAAWGASETSLNNTITCSACSPVTDTGILIL